VNKKKVIIITPTIGTKYLSQCHESVLSQTYENIDHLIVVDGEKFKKTVNKRLQNYNPIKCVVPYNTGESGYNGHRIYAAFPFLLECDYVLFLDEDNWLEPNHVKSLVDILEHNNHDWCFSLRNIYSKEGEYLFQDNCESLGNWSFSELVDTNCYFFKLNFIRKYCFLWDFPGPVDRRFYSYIKNIIKHTNYGCSGLYTCNYRLGGNPNSVTKEFFINGNQKIKQVYLEKFPWSVKS
jgi:glycosyltransferase involved in cell wall biosynthesis